MRYVLTCQFLTITKGVYMSILLMSPQLQEFCEKHNLYEYGVTHVITMPDGFKFTTQDSELAESFRRGSDTLAFVDTIVELGE